jgi:hypothetical protein
MSANIEKAAVMLHIAPKLLLPFVNVVVVHLEN